MKALVNITYQGQAANYEADLDPDLDDNTIKSICIEAIRNNEVPGISAQIPVNAFDNFVVDRFQDPLRFVVRPKVPFGTVEKNETQTL